MIFSTFKELYSHYHNPVVEHFRQPKEFIHTHLHSSVPGYLLSFLTHLPSLDISKMHLASLT